MSDRQSAKREPVTLTDREQTVQYLLMLRDHRRHQRKVGSIHKLGRQELAHADYATRHAHRLSQPRRLTLYQWLVELQAFDFRAYQSKLMGVDLRDHETYLWWMGLGDEQRYSAIRVGAAAARDEREQDDRYAKIEAMKKARESGEA